MEGIANAQTLRTNWVCCLRNSVAEADAFGVGVLEMILKYNRQAGMGSWWG